jgi:deazaflavin-dependent oxidoreductase (nitroreductase family)
MSVQKPPGGTRGTRPPPRLVGKIITPMMVRIHRRSGDRFAGMNLLYLTTVGARSGQLRTNPVARFEDGQGGWIIVASAGGTASHPAWYHNLAANPGQVWAEVSGTKHRVEVEQLDGELRDRVWSLVVEHAPRFATYPIKTDRQIPLLRLTPVPDPVAPGP